MTPTSHRAPDAHDAPDAASAGGAPLLKATGIDVTFPGVHAARGVDLTVVPGRVLALLGESGSGKSVTAMSLVGLAPGAADVGGSAVLRDGTQLIGAERAALDAVRGARVATVFQEPMRAINPLLSIATHLRLALGAHGSPGRDEVRERSIALLESVGLGGGTRGGSGGGTAGGAERVLASYPHQLSGGQVQRVCIALALAGEPEVLLADEPTTALDVTVQAAILDLLRSLARQGMGVVLITHDMGVVADIADDVAIMRRGEIVERGSVDEIFSAPRHEYTRMLLDAVPRLGAVTAPDLASETGPATGSVAVRPASTIATTARPNTAATTDTTDKAATVSEPVVDLRDLAVTFRRRGRPDVRALDGVSLRIEAGQVVGLVGESGSGKSTLANVVTSLQAPTSGTARILGTDMTTAARRERVAVQARTGIVFQDPAGSLNPRATIGRSIAEPLVLHGDLGAAAREDRVAQLLGLVELDPDLASRFPHELSGGQRQRVAIARAIALDPALVVADEPTSALDVSVQAAVLAMFLELQRRLGFACLFISHDLAVVERVSSAVHVLHHGKVVEHGPTREVLAHPRDPYTRGLIDAVPVPDPQVQRRRRAARLDRARTTVTTTTTTPQD